MDANVWLGAGSGLLGAVIGACAALVGQTLDARRSSRDAAANEHKLAVEEVLVRSQAIDLRARQAMTLAANLGSFTGLLSRMLGNLAPIDLQVLFDRMDEEANGLQRAASRVWLFADERTVALTNAVVLAAMDVVEAHHTPERNRAAALAQVAIFGKFASSSDRTVELRQALSEVRRELVQHARLEMGLAVIDPWAVASRESPPQPSCLATTEYLKACGDSSFTAVPERQRPSLLR